MPTNWDAVRRAVDAGNVCDRCLGRAFGAAGTGMDNLLRGRMIRAAATGPVPPSPDADVAAMFSSIRPADGPGAPAEGCRICEGMMGRLDGYAMLVQGALADIEYATFQVGSRFDTQVVEGETAAWTELATASPESIKSEFNREVGKLCEAALGKPAERERPDVVAIVDTRFDTVSLQLSPVFVFGRYRKLERGIPQTHWGCRVCRGRGCDRCGGTGKMYTTSVEEMIAPRMVEAFQGKAAYLHGMGREDIDARMLGSGRPFVMEVSDPRRRAADLAALERAANADMGGRVEVLGLRPSSREEMVQVKGSRHEKTYQAEFELGGPAAEEKVKSAIESLRGLQIDQQTPNRVAHRRADLVRNRRVLDAQLVSMTGNRAAVRFRGEAGLYIKELIHGDNGRTHPSLAEVLGVPCTVLALDVLEVHDTRENEMGD